MTFLFEMGKWEGLAPNDPSIRLGELELFAKRVDRSKHPAAAKAVDAEIAARKAADAAIIAADTKPASRPAARPAPGGMPMPCGHPVSDMDWQDQEQGKTFCRGCTEEDACAQMIFDGMGTAVGGLTIGQIREHVRRLTFSLRKRLE